MPQTNIRIVPYSFNSHFTPISNDQDLQVFTFFKYRYRRRWAFFWCHRCGYFFDRPFVASCTYLPVYLSTCLPIERASFYFLLNFMALERGKVEKNYQNWFVLLRPENRLTRMAFFPFGRPQSGKMLFLRQRGPARLVSSPRPLFMEKKRIRVKRKSSANVLCSFLFRSFYFLILHKVTNTKATKTGRGSKGDKNKLKWHNRCCW